MLELRIVQDWRVNLTFFLLKTPRLSLSILVISLNLWVARVMSDGTVLINTRSGQIRGIPRKILHRKINVFLGIPFAEPPINNLRFKLPVPVEPWSGIFNATSKPSSCMQMMDNSFDRDFVGSNQWNPQTMLSEDCLYLNIWAPVNKSDKDIKAVMVWIYGGGFATGSASLDLYDGAILAAEGDVLVVTLNYRVGPLGFLSFGNSECPGNVGLFDQLVALDWIQENIRSFGGDPRNVTLFGESAGAVSVSLHAISPLSRGKFERIIMQSGSATSAWAVITRAEALERSTKLAHEMNCHESNSAETLVCLRKKNALTFSKMEYTIINGLWQFPFVPMVDGTFILENPSLLLRRGYYKRTPILLGTNANEGSWLLPYHFREKFPIEEPPSLNQETFQKYISRLVRFYPRYPYPLSQIGKDAVLFQYTPWINPHDGARNADAIQNLIGDFHMTCGCTELANFFSLHSNSVFYYSFEHRSSKQPWPKWMGVMHGDEIHFVFGLPLRPRSGFHRAEKDLSRKMIKYWTNYAKTGNPNYGPLDKTYNDEWPVYKLKEYKYLTLNTKLVRHPTRLKNTVKVGPRINQCAFWRVYLPQLHAATVNITEAEIEWKKQFHIWSTEYIVDWRQQFEIFISSKQRRYNTCHDDL